MPAIMASKIYTKDELCLFERKPSDCGITIFGASGDLTKRKLIPSLFHLYVKDILPKQFFVLGVARTAMTDPEFRAHVLEAISESTDEKKKNAFAERFFYLSGNYREESLYAELKKTQDKLDEKFKTEGRQIYYLSTPPSLYPEIIQFLGQSGLAHISQERTHWSRVIIEKPFGYDSASAKELNLKVKQHLDESQIYRIDHYLGKETVQNILMFRFANILFEPVWNRNYIDHVQITAAESIGVEHRAGYYEQAGILRDMFQNHLFQLLALIAMEPPSNLDANAVRDKKIDVFRCVKTLSPLDLGNHVVCGQYGPGKVDGKDVLGYREEKEVNSNSVTPTFAAMKLDIENWRWQGVPFYIRAGKRLPKRLVEISVHFKRVPTSIFKPLLADQLTANVLKFRIQPDEGIMMNFEAKHPGPKLCMSTVMMDFGYQETFGTPPPESYSRLFLDAMLGDQTLFARSDGVEESWRILDLILNCFENDSHLKLPIYPAGSWGPKESDTLLSQNGRSWA